MCIVKYRHETILPLIPFPAACLTGGREGWKGFFIAAFAKGGELSINIFSLNHQPESYVK